MRWRKARRSDNVVDARGSSIKIGVKGLSLSGIVILFIVGFLSGQDPLQILGNIAGQALQPTRVETRKAPPADDEQSEFVRAILGDTEDTWRQIFRQSGARYQDPHLVLFSNGVGSACGFATSAVGPFYCPGDQRVYLDLDFFREMEQRFQATGEFARAYVIAHEVGHHVQKLLGITQWVDDARRHGREVKGAAGLSVRQELQADCFAGVWAHHAQNRHAWLDPGDLADALNVANAIGDDRLQKQTTGQTVPDSFTHGTSDQRQRWFTKGYETGDTDQCNTFNTRSL